MKNILTLALLLLGAVWSMAQTNFRQRQITMDDGLPSNSVNRIVQDRLGFVWMATENGLCRYDGRHVSDYLLPEQSSHHITALLPLSEQELLVGTTGQLLRLSLATEQMEPVPTGLTKPVRQLAQDRDGNLWVATEGQGLVSLSPDGESLHTYALTECGGMVNDVFCDEQNQVWAVCNKGAGGLWRLNKQRDTFEPAQIANASDSPTDLTCMMQTADGQRWIGSWEHGLWLLNDERRIEPMPMATAGHCLHIHSLVPMAPNSLLVCCDDGLWLFNTTTHTFTIYQPQRFVHTAMLDTEGGLWIGTTYGGTTYVSPIARRFDATAGGLVSCFAEDRHGRIWVADNASGISCYNHGRRIDNFPGRQRLEHLNVHAICTDGDDLWIGTYNNGVYILNTNNGQLRHFLPDDTDHSLYDASCYAIFRNHDGNIWVACGEGLCRYDRTAGHFSRCPKLPSTVIDIDEDDQHHLWLSTQGSGLICLDADGQTKTYRHQPSNQQTLANDIVNCTLIDGNGRIWVGTQGGLCQYDPAIDNFTRVRLDVPRQAVASIVEDQGVLWLSGDCGVLKYTPGESIWRFTRQDGLVSEQFQPNSVLKASDGRIYFGTIQGFNSFSPYQLKVNNIQPPVYLTQLEIGNSIIPVGNWHLPKALPYMEQLDLYYNDQVFSLSFASLSYHSPEKNMYAYMLEGFDKQWNYVAGDRHATYTNLPAGTYTFRVKATNNDGIWSDHEARLKIIIHPPFWWSTYAKVAYVCLAILLLWGFIVLRLKLAERRHRRELEELSQQKENEMQQARMDFFTTIAHEIRTPVSLIIGPLDTLKQQLAAKSDSKDGKGQDIVESNLDIIDRNAHRLLDLVGQLLDFRKVGQQHTLTFTVQNMTDLLRTVANDFIPALQGEGITLSLDLPQHRLMAAVDAEAMTKVVSNLLSNARKYTRNRITLLCRPASNGQQLVIEVTDNGPGIPHDDQQRVFQPFFQTTGSKPGTGIGLSIVKRLVEDHHGIVSVESVMGQGTTFRILLPLQQEVVSESKPAATAAEAAPDEQAATAPATQAKPRMLIVDDNEDMLTFLVTTFMDQYEVTAARNGNEALELLRESLIVKDGQTPTTAYSIVISDWMMDKMDGPELCSRLRQNPATKDLPFILLTAKTDSQSKVQAMEVGVDAFIEKPFAVKYLEACIRNLLSRRDQG